MKQVLASDYNRGPEKRAFDVVFAGTAGTGTVALLGGTLSAVAIAALNRKNPIFTQKRNGEAGIPFSAIKFRTMDNEEELLKLGAWARRRGLDETPQFINVLLGQMSVVGYRPLVDADTNHATQRLKNHFLDSSPYHPSRWLNLREQCKPGITGPSQTMTVRPDAGSINHLIDVVAAECAYMENANLKTDLHFVAITPFVLGRDHNVTVERAVK